MQDQNTKIELFKIVGMIENVTSHIIQNRIEIDMETENLMENLCIKLSSEEIKQMQIGDITESEMKEFLIDSLKHASEKLDELIRT